jgi:hypothetical protein
MDTRNTEPRPIGAESRPKPSRAKTIRRLVIMVVALVVVFGALYGFNEFRKQAIANYFASNVPPPIPIAAVEAKAAPMPRYLEGIGGLAAVHQVTLAPARRRGRAGRPAQLPGHGAPGRRQSPAQPRAGA